MLPIHNILYPTDFSERSAHAFNLASALARDYKANLYILHVFQESVTIYMEGGMIPTPPEEPLDDLRERLLKYHEANVHVTHLLEEGNPANEILRTAGQIPADIIVMGTHGRHGLSRLLMGSIAEFVLERATCPVLVAKTPFPVERFPLPMPPRKNWCIGRGVCREFSLAAS